MRSPTTTTTILTYGLLALAGGVSLTLPKDLGVQTSLAAAPSSSSSDVLELDCLIRDFRGSHPDFNAKVSGGNGHYAGNVALALAANDCPTFTGSGYKVDKQWKDRDASNIAPHMYTSNGSVLLASAPDIDKDAFFDMWDSSKGAYGPSNQGTAPTVKTNASMPTLTAPTTLGPSVGNVTYELAPTLSADLHCNNFATEQNTVLSISGHRTILCEGSFALGKLTQVLILPNSSLTLYVKGAFSINQGSQVNMNTWKPGLCRMYNLGSSTVEINQSNQVCATVISPSGPMHLHQNDHFYGTFIGKGLQLDKATGFHSDGRENDYCGIGFDDTYGAAGSASTGGISSTSTFNQWFVDEPGVNLSTQQTIRLMRNSDGVYEYVNHAFHPIDGQLFGNEGSVHNHYFTLAASTVFTHHACDKRFFEFAGADDAWLFIDGQMVIDLGGLAPLTAQSITMDRLNLVDGQQYRLDFFYAQRQASSAGFSIRTNLDLLKRAVPYTMSAGVD